MTPIMGTVRNGQIVVDQPVEWPEGCRVVIEPAANEETLKERFRRLSAVWQKETAYLSSMTEASHHPAYQEIIHLGPDVIPLLLRDLQAHHTHWFAALHALTGAEPIDPSVAGNVPKMVDAWLCWAKEHGYQW
ncbi:MAG TPA: hypothetical protein VE999_01035 [Gemmataceae bacterium]|nr:hypothetical protein [Gemmataceae bacterium]